jgi:hypothetical protein
MDISVHLLNVINIIPEVDHLRFESDKRQDKEVYDEPQYSTERHHSFHFWSLRHSKNSILFC